MNRTHWTAVLTLVASAGMPMSCKPKGATSDGADAQSSVSTPAVTTVPKEAKPKLPPDPPPRIADRASEAPALEAQLVGDKAYGPLWDEKHVDDRNLVLTAVSELLITEEVGNEQVFIPETIAKELGRRKLMEIVLKVSAIIPRTGKLPTDFEVKTKSHLSNIANGTRHGVWMPKQSGALPVDFAGLAYWLNPDDAGYLREFVTARRDGQIGWENSPKPVRPYLARERVALERLSMLTTLTAEETARLSELKASKLGDAPPEAIELAKLLKEYGSNEVRADDAYKNHVVEFSGIAGALERGAIGGITLPIGTGKPFERPVAHCFFDDAQTKRVKELNKGDRVRVRGKVDGLMMNVIVRSCEVVD